MKTIPAVVMADILHVATVALEVKGMGITPDINIPPEVAEWLSGQALPYHPNKDVRDWALNELREVTNDKIPGDDLR